MKKIKLVIFGVEDTAELAHYYFSNDSQYEVVAFTLDQEYCDKKYFLDLPLVPFEQILENYSPDEFQLFIALGYSAVNELRKSKYIQAKEYGYTLASYISSKTNILNDGLIGDNCFILEDNTIQPFVHIGNNVTLWSGNHIGHHSVISDHAFLASHVVVSGRVNIGEQCFVGVNATIRDHVDIGERSVVGAGVLLLRSCDAESVFKGAAARPSSISSSQLKRI